MRSMLYIADPPAITGVPSETVIIEENMQSLLTIVADPILTISHVGMSLQERWWIMLDLVVHQDV